jgi:cytochrome c oxidase assembly factor CtaG/cytochrome c2
MMLLPAVAAGHEGQPLAPHDLLTAWVWDPLIGLPLALSGLLYYAGASKARGLLRWEVVCFWSGWVALVLALMSPLHPLGEVLFAAHMAQHEVMMVIAAPLLVLGRPLVAFLWALPPAARRACGEWSKSKPVAGSWQFITRPFTAFFLHLAAVWAWHIPRAYQATITSDAVHTAQHFSFLVSALVFWWAVIRQHVARKHYGAGLLYIFGTAVHTSILGALLTFSTTVWYPVYTQSVGRWGLTALEDQQLGGLIMWIPPGFVYLGIFLGMFVLWMNDRPESRLKAVSTICFVAAVLGMSGCSTNPDPEFSGQEILPGANPARGRQLIQAYGCTTCHTIPGIPAATGTVGPPLTAVGLRTYLAGRITNTPANMVRWIHNPKSVDDQTAMPVTGITEVEARDVARYLYSLR